MDALIRVRAACALAAALAALAAPAAERSEAPLPARNRALLLLRILTYDRNLGRRPAERAEIALVYRAGDGRSEADRAALLAAFADVSREVVAGGRPVSARAVPFRGEADLAARVAELRPIALYVCEGLAASASEITRASRRERILSAGGSRELATAGVAVALVSRGSRAAVVVNLAAARAEGAELDAALLALAEVVEDRTAGSP